MLQFKHVNEERFFYAFIYLLISLKIGVEFWINSNLTGIVEIAFGILLPLIFLVVSFSFAIINDQKYKTMRLLKLPAYIGLVYIVFYM